MAQPYSDALMARGPLLFLSGQSPEAPDGDVPGDVAGQTRQILDNMRRLLAEHGATLGDLVKLTSFVRHANDVEQFRAALVDSLPDGHRPAGTLVEVSGFADPRFLVQIEAVAAVEER